MITAKETLLHLENITFVAKTKQNKKDNSFVPVNEEF